MTQTVLISPCSRSRGRTRHGSWKSRSSWSACTVLGARVGVPFPCTCVHVFVCVQNPSLGSTAASHLPESLQTLRLGTGPQGWSWSLTAPSCAEQAYAFNVLGARQVWAQNFYHPLTALFCSAISPIQRQILINKRKEMKLAFAFQQSTWQGAPWCACLGERSSCASQRENCKCSFRIRQPSKAVPKQSPSGHYSTVLPQKFCSFSGALVMCCQTAEEPGPLTGCGTGALCCLSFPILLLPAKDIVKVNAISAEKGSQIIGVKDWEQI